MQNRGWNQSTEKQGREESSIAKSLAAQSTRDLAYYLAFWNRRLRGNASRSIRCGDYRNCNYCPNARNISTGLQTHAIEAKKIVDQYYEDNAGGLLYPGSPVDSNDHEFYGPPTDLSSSSDSDSSSSWSIVSSSSLRCGEQESSETRGGSKTDHDGPEFD